MIKKLAKKVNWKITNRSTWDKEWKHEPTEVYIRVSSDVNNAAGHRTVGWILELNTPSDRFVIEENYRELGNLKGSYITQKDRVIKNDFIKTAKKMMRKSNGFTTINQFHELVYLFH